MVCLFLGLRVGSEDTTKENFLRQEFVSGERTDLYSKVGTSKTNNGAATIKLVPSKVSTVTRRSIR